MPQTVFNLIGYSLFSFMLRYTVEKHIGYKVPVDGAEVPLYAKLNPGQSDESKF